MFTAAMAGQSELLSFMTKFLNLVNSGKSAKLNAECQDGKAVVTLQHYIESCNPPPPPPCEQHGTPPRRQPGPSRVRRRARRALARAEAAAKAAPAAAEEAAAPLPTEKATTETSDAEKAAPPTVDAAVQVVSPDQVPHHHLLRAAQAPPQAPLQLSPAVEDVFCPDRDFLSEHIPQLDGGPILNEQDQDEVWSCQC